MAIPMSLTIVLLALLIAYLLRELAHEKERGEALRTEILDMSRTYVQSASQMVHDREKSASERDRNSAKYAEKMVDSLAAATQQVMNSVTSTMHTMYGPATPPQVTHDPAAYGGSPPMEPWYAHEGAVDGTDPTDTFLNEGVLGGLSDGAAHAPGNLITDDDDEPFGIPGLKVEG